MRFEREWGQTTPPMRPQILRLVVTLATFIVAWFVLPSAAHAAVQAPVCDPRGAITFAPPPQLQDPETSLDIVVDDDDCTKSPLEQRSVTPERTAPQVAASSARDPATSGIVVPIACAPSERLPAPDVSPSCPRRGFRASLERPPRA